MDTHKKQNGKIGSYLFVHGGISREVLRTGYFTQQMNDLIRRNLGKAEDKFQNNVKRIPFGEQGPLWYRGLVYQEQEFYAVIGNDVDDVLSF